MSIPGPVTWIAFTVIVPWFPFTELVCSLSMTLIPPGNVIATLGIGAEIGRPSNVTSTSCELPLTDGVVPLHDAVLVDLTMSADSPTIGTDTLTSDACDVLWSPLPLVVPCNRPTVTSPSTFRFVSDADCDPPVDGSWPVSPIATLAPNAETLNGRA